MHHILQNEQIHLRLVGRTGKLLGANNEINALDNQLVIFLLSICSWSCRLAHKVVRWRNQLYVEIDILKNKALLVENVQLRATGELDQGTSRECRGASVQPGIVPNDCGDIHVPAGVFCPSLA